MPKAASKKKTAEPASRGRHARQKEKRDSSEQRNEDEDGLFVSQSSPPPARAPRRLNANKPAKVQPVNSKMDEGDRTSNRNMDKNERVQGRTAAGRKSNKLLDDFEKLVNHRNNVAEKEIKDVLARRVTSEESFLNGFHTTFTSITNDGLTTSKSGDACHLLRHTTETVLSKAHNLLQESQNGMLKLSSDNTSAILMETEENWALSFQHTESILEVGRLVGEDKINAKLSGLVPIVHDPDYSDASAALFATDEEVETWAKAARNQGRVVKKMTAAIGEY